MKRLVQALVLVLLAPKMAEASACFSAPECATISCDFKAAAS